ncbi:hypothetical protein [Phycicoccus sonneratiae]|uniref:Uncharacterized protein n=1 Tax=Phycicoccus sonneratiae TaxID=2807628 RepID=A0ABS2CNN7_9MICO|nr:hypothetical protein [Phycicoccus sonneraticus]MBM6401395.1 hypothetical protein [Phycicoccus sonneraticus]
MGSPRGTPRRLGAALGLAGLLVVGCAPPPSTPHDAAGLGGAVRVDHRSADDLLEHRHFLGRPADGRHPHPDASIGRADRAAAQLATAAFQDEEVAEAAGWRSTLEALGCFQSPGRGGMGVHFVNDALLDDRVDVSRPEALVYELDRDGAVAGLVAHEYIVPVDAWTRSTPPQLFGVAFHRHPSLPLYVLHAWVWKDNARGDLDDWNPAVRLCPPGVPIFGEDRRASSSARS